MAQKFRHFLLAIVCILPGIVINAADPNSYLLFSISSQNKARLGIVNTTKRNLKLEMIDKNGLLLFDKVVSGNQNFFQLLDLSTMPNGEYTVKLTRGIDDVVEKKFMVLNGIASVVKEREEVKPVFKLVDDNSLIVSYLNAKSNTVSIFFERDEEVVFEDRGITDMPVSKRYSLAKLPKGFYTVKLYSGGNIYSYNLSLN
jgi:hypothetical protein